MKKIIALVIMCLTLTITVFAEGIDYTNMSPEELQQLIDNASAALGDMEGATEYPGFLLMHYLADTVKMRQLLI